MVILRCKNCGEANWKIYIKKICSASTCRMTMIRRALDSPMSKDLPRYLERCRRPHKKFSRVAWKKVPAQNMRFCQNIRVWLWASFFKISTFFTFPDIYSDWCVVWSRFFLLTQRTRLGGPFRYPEHVRQANRKFSRGLRKKVSPQKMRFCQNFMGFLQLRRRESVFTLKLTVPYVW